MGLGGYVKYYDGVAEAWSLWRKKTAEKHAKSMILSARTLNDEYISEHKIWRLQATRPAGIPGTWFKHMGFIKECTHEYYGMNGEHTDMYCKIIKRHLPDRN